jgi:hypothetical protein
MIDSVAEEVYPPGEGLRRAPTLHSIPRGPLFLGKAAGSLRLTRVDRTIE